MFEINIDKPRPYFAEVPYYLWGSVSYDSEGNCRSPKDREWTWLELSNRDSDEKITITRGRDTIAYTGPETLDRNLRCFVSSEHMEFSRDESSWWVSGSDESAARICLLLVDRCDATPIGFNPVSLAGDWNHLAALQRAHRVRQEFEREELEPFAVGHAFWGGWKHIGWRGTSFTWLERWIMDALVRRDSRAVFPCVCWLRDGTRMPAQSIALRQALKHLTGQDYQTDVDWVDWYFDGAGKNKYPEPDIDEWFADLKRIHGDT